MFRCPVSVSRIRRDPASGLVRQCEPPAIRASRHRLLRSPFDCILLSITNAASHELVDPSASVLRCSAPVDEEKGSWTARAVAHSRSSLPSRRPTTALRCSPSSRSGARFAGANSQTVVPRVANQVLSGFGFVIVDQEGLKLPRGGLMIATRWTVMTAALTKKMSGPAARRSNRQEWLSSRFKARGRRLELIVASVATELGPSCDPMRRRMGWG